MTFLQEKRIIHRWSGQFVGWLFGFNSPLRQYFSLYRVVSQKEGERREMIDERKNSLTTPPAPTASAEALILL